MSDRSTLLALNDQQALQHRPEDTDWPDWSRYARDVVFANASGWTEALRSWSPATLDLLAALQDWVAPHTDAPLSTTDAVHGDFLPENVLVRDGQVAAVIDFAQAGCGTRALDLARTLVWWYDDTAEAERQRILDRIAAIATEAEFAICLASQVIDVVAFVIEHHQHEVERFAHRGNGLLRAAQQRGGAGPRT